MSQLEPGRVVRMKFISREFVRSHPEKIFVFGDNMQRRGYGGQAAAMRGEPNTIGIPTKWAPRRDHRAFFSDGDWDNEAVIAAIRDGFACIKATLLAGSDVVIPMDGLGTGSAELSTRAPKIAAFIEKQLAMLGGRAMSQLEPGPAFIAWFGISREGEPNHLARVIVKGKRPAQVVYIPPGYVWQPQTIGTMAGWVRPSGKATRDGGVI